MANNQILYLSQAEVASVGLGMAEIIQLLEKAFEEKGYGRVEMPPKPGIHPGEGDNFIHAMPAYIPALNSAGIKWVSGFPKNAQKGLPYITGLLILNDPETGIPLAVMDCEWITAMRTAAASAVAAKRLARPESARLGILGCGVQGITNTEALSVPFSIEEVFAYDILPEAIEKFSQAKCLGRVFPHSDGDGKFFLVRTAVVREDPAPQKAEGGLMSGFGGNFLSFFFPKRIIRPFQS